MSSTGGECAACAPREHRGEAAGRRARPRQARPGGSPWAFSWCRAGPRVWQRARPRAGGTALPAPRESSEARPRRRGSADEPRPPRPRVRRPRAPPSRPAAPTLNPPPLATPPQPLFLYLAQARRARRQARAAPPARQPRAARARLWPSAVSSAAANARRLRWPAVQQHMHQGGAMGRRAHPRQARPGRALGLSRGAGPGRGCSAPGPLARCALFLAAASSLTHRSLSLPSRRQGVRAQRRRRLHVQGPGPGRLLLQRPRAHHGHGLRRFVQTSAANNRGPPSHILGRPGPGEPSGFLVVPGRAEGVARPAHVANPHPLPAPLPTRPRSLPRCRQDGLGPERARRPDQVGGCR